MTRPAYAFYRRLARIFNSGQSRCVMLHGNINDLFWDGADYVPLIGYVQEKTGVSGLIRLVYELTGPIRVDPAHYDRLRDAWISWKTGMEPDSLNLRDLKRRENVLEQRRNEYEALIRGSIGNATQALEFLRQLTICSRTTLRENLLIIIEAADMLLPAGRGDVATLNDAQLRRISIVPDWFGDPQFVAGGDSVCLIAESRSEVHPRIARLPQLLAVDVPAPSTEHRRHYIEHFRSVAPTPARLWSTPDSLAEFSAGLSIHALRQLLVEAAYSDRAMEPSDVVLMVEHFIQSQLGEDVVEFKKPAHALEQVVGFSPAEAIPPREDDSTVEAERRRGAAGCGGRRADRRRQDLYLRGGGGRAGYARAGAQEHPQPMVRPDRRDLRAAATRAGSAREGGHLRR